MRAIWWKQFNTMMYSVFLIQLLTWCQNIELIWIIWNVTNPVHCNCSFWVTSNMGKVFAWWNIHLTLPRYQFYLARPWVGSKARERQPLAPGQIGEHGPLFLAINEGIADHIDQLLYESFRTSFWDKPKAMINDRHVLPRFSSASEHSRPRVFCSPLSLALLGRLIS